MIYGNLKSFIKKVDRYESNPEKSPIAKVAEHIPSSFSISAISSRKCIQAGMVENIEEVL